MKCPYCDQEIIAPEYHTEIRLRGVLIGEGWICAHCLRVAIFSDNRLSRIEDIIPDSDWVEVEGAKAIYRWVPDLVMSIEGLPDYASPITKISLDDA
jgi:hypothetical protein